MMARLRAKCEEERTEVFIHISQNLIYMLRFVLNDISHKNTFHEILHISLEISHRILLNEIFHTQNISANHRSQDILWSNNEL